LCIGEFDAQHPAKVTERQAAEMRITEL
jgi:hypothetical protein